MSTTPTDPCASFDDANGNFDFIAYLDAAIATVECGIEQAKALGGALGLVTAQHAQLAVSQLRGAQAVHLAALKPPQTET